MELAHTSNLAFLSPLFLSVACFVAGGIWLMLWTRNRNTYMLPTALSWLALCVYFGILTISAGSHPVASRGDIAMPLRQWGFLVAGLIIAGKALLLRALWRNGRRAARNSP